MVAAGAATVWGCGAPKQAAPTEPVPVPAPKATAPSKAAALGAEQPAGPFTATLSADPSPPKAGAVHLMVKLVESGKPVDGAVVTLVPSMPSMGHDLPEVVLKAAGGGLYQGDADLGMVGEYQAKVSVAQAGRTGEAVFAFSVAE